MKKVNKENVEKEIRNLLVKFDKELNDRFEKEGMLDDLVRCSYAVNPMIKFEEKKSYVEFRFDGEVYELVNEEWTESFSKMFREKMKELGWNWEFETSSIIQIYKGV